MPGLLSTVRENWAAFLRTDADSGAAAYFNTAPAIDIYTEKRKTLEQDVTNQLLRVGLNVLIATVTAKQAQNQTIGKLHLADILAIARVFENPNVNTTGVAASDCAEVIAEFTRKFKPFGAPMKLAGIQLADDALAPLAYDVIYTLDASAPITLTRTPVL